MAQELSGLLPDEATIKAGPLSRQDHMSEAGGGVTRWAEVNYRAEPFELFDEVQPLVSDMAHLSHHVASC